MKSFKEHIIESTGTICLMIIGSNIGKAVCTYYNLDMINESLFALSFTELPGYILGILIVSLIAYTWERRSKKN